MATVNESRGGGPLDALARRIAAPTFTLTLFMSAALTFSLQPLFGRLVTPMLGGSPAVWNTSMAFFQGALLVGYLYADLLQRVRDLRVQILVHALALALAWLTLPLHVSTLFGPPTSEHPAFWLLGVLTLSVGAPFAVASATAPLLQAWYARTGRADAHDPYYLYAASNLGSFAGLLAYPILVEPLFGLAGQTALWTGGYLTVAVMIAIAGTAALSWRRTQAVAEPETGDAITWRQRLYWLAASAIPSSLILGVTQHISTDVASAPFLWVLPLALYLLTFVIAFARGGQAVAPFVLFAQPPLLALLVITYFSRGEFIWSLLANLGCFFLSALICHLALARTRPPAGRLTEFYLWVSIGGVVGGAITALVAPVIFDDIYEYPLALAAIALFRPSQEPSRISTSNASAAASLAMVGAMLALFWRNPPEVALFAGGIGAAMALLAASFASVEGPRTPMQIGFLGVAVVLALGLTAGLVEADWLIIRSGSEASIAPLGYALLALSFIVLVFTIHATLGPRSPRPLATEIALGIGAAGLTAFIFMMLALTDFDRAAMLKIALAFAAIALILNRDRPRLLAMLVLAAFTIVFAYDRTGGRVIAQERSFFGVLRTEQYDPGERGAPALRVLMHGTTIHGAQFTGQGGMSRQPLTYYNPSTALGEAMQAGIQGGERTRFALIGLGAGTSACLLRPQDELTIFEIDPNVVRLSAGSQALFSYVNECKPQYQVELGDARLRMTQSAGGFDVITVDAFSSDAIPAHLLTTEAVRLYLSKTSERGIVILHLSNRNLALVSEATRVAHALGVPFLWRVSTADRTLGAFGGLPASAMILARDPAVLASLHLQSPDWTALPLPPGRAWSDDYINLPRSLLESFNGVEDCLTRDHQVGCAAGDKN